jgi:hypothetical protein
MVLGWGETSAKHSGRCPGYVAHHSLPYCFVPFSYFLHDEHVFLNEQIVIRI